MNPLYKKIPCFVCEGHYGDKEMIRIDYNGINVTGLIDSNCLSRTDGDYSVDGEIVSFDEYYYYVQIKGFSLFLNNHKYPEALSRIKMPHYQNMDVFYA